jgi:ATP-dependent helicase/DNAse subunit B
MSNLRLQGYSNEEVNILDKFDSGFENSRVVRGLKTTSKGFANYSKVIDNDKIDKLVSIVDSKIDDATKDIREAKFDINPKRIGKINYGCEFCKFKDICFMTENDIVNLKEYKKLEFLGGEDDDTGEA